MNRDDAIISRFTDAPGTIYQVAEADQLTTAAHYGFSLAAVLYEDRLVTPEAPQDSGYASTYGGPSPKPDPVAQPAVVLRQARYLMRKDAESALRDERQERAAADAQLKEARRQIREHQESDAQKEQAQKKLQAELRTVGDNQAALLRNMEADRAAKRKLETDIAKLRVALGDLRMKEILGS